MNELKREIEKLEKKRHKLTLQIAEKVRQLKDTCKHEKTEVKNNYIEGSYYDKAQYITQTVCSTCEKVLGETIEYGSYA